MSKRRENLPGGRSNFISKHCRNSAASRKLWQMRSPMIAACLRRAGYRSKNPTRARVSGPIEVVEMNDDSSDEPTPENKQKTARDDQTNKVFVLKPETKWAAFVASISAVYLIVTLAFLLWLLLDTWSGRNQLLHHFGYGKDILDRESFRLLAFVAIAGALGATVDGIRSIVSWHSEREAYGPRFIWKDLSLPFIGAALGLIVYVTVRGGVGVF